MSTILTILFHLLKAFLVGGVICTIGEAFVLRTKLTPARILVGYIVGGVILSGVGLYGPIVDFAGAGATIPLTGFGHALTTGVRRAIEEVGFMGVFTGGLTQTAAGISAAVFAGTLVALVCKPHPKQ